LAGWVQGLPHQGGGDIKEAPSLLEESWSVTGGDNDQKKNKQMSSGSSLDSSIAGPYTLNIAQADSNPNKDCDYEADS